MELTICHHLKVFPFFFFFLILKFFPGDSIWFKCFFFRIDLNWLDIFCTGLSRFIGCNHLRSVEFFTESFNSACPFLAVQCPSFADFLAGGCQCGTNACHRMGYSADHQSVISSSSSGIHNWPSPQQPIELEPKQMYLLTRDDQPFCCNPTLN